MKREKKLQERQERFIHKINNIYGDKSEIVIKGLSERRNQTFRINTIKSDVKRIISEIEKLSGDKVQRLKLTNAYSLDSTFQLSRSDFANNFDIYLQDASSMLPVEILEPKADELILDICAAPGSKTGQIAMNTDNQARIFATEPVKPRFLKMQMLLEKQGVKLERLILSEGNYLYKKYPDFINYFDKCVVDVPCTNENAIIPNDLKSFEHWSSKNPKNISRLQKSILASAFTMLRKGGKLIYSTCTFSVEENEEVVNWLLENFEDARVINIDNKLINLEVDYVNGLTEFNKKEFNTNIKNSIRVLPNSNFGGFFLCLIEKI